jgi:small-conductance mechanosensitive channel
LIDSFAGWITSAQLGRAVAAFLVLGIGLLLARLGGAAVGRLVARRGTAQQSLIARRSVFYGTLGLAVASALRQLGVDLSVLLGAAGVLTVALGFASQTSASNLISGLFLIAERPFVVGDVIRIGTTTGEVVTIDLLSVKLRTLDNLSVRIPNETLLKSEITNLSRYPIRRVDVKVTVGFRQDLTRVRHLFEAIAAAQPLSFDEPRPQFSVRGFTDAGIELQLSVWAQRDNVVEVSNSLQLGIQEAFTRESVELPSRQPVLLQAESAAGRGGIAPSA